MTAKSAPTTTSSRSGGWPTTCRGSGSSNGGSESRGLADQTTGSRETTARRGASRLTTCPPRATPSTASSKARMGGRNGRSTGTSRWSAMRGSGSDTCRRGVSPVVTAPWSLPTRCSASTHCCTCLASAQPSASRSTSADNKNTNGAATRCRLSSPGAFAVARRSSTTSVTGTSARRSAGGSPAW